MCSQVPRKQIDRYSLLSQTVAGAVVLKGTRIPPPVSTREKDLSEVPSLASREWIGVGVRGTPQMIA